MDDTCNTNITLEIDSRYCAVLNEFQILLRYICFYILTMTMSIYLNESHVIRLVFVIYICYFQSDTGLFRTSDHILV